MALRKQNLIVYESLKIIIKVQNKDKNCLNVYTVIEKNIVNLSLYY